MFCGECGTENPETNTFCKNCGRALRKPAEAPTTQPAAAPVQQQAATVPVVTPPVPAAGEKPKRMWLGIVSIIPAILSLLIYPYLLGIGAVVIGIASILLARKQGTRFPVAGVIGVIIGMLSIIMNMFWLDIFPPGQILPPIQ